MPPSMADSITVSKMDCVMTVANCTHSIPARPGLLVRLFDRVLDWLDRSRQRSALGRLDERLLTDLGLDRATAAEEAAKRFWRA